MRTLTAHGIYPQDLHMGIVVSPGDTEVSLTCTGCGRSAKPYRHGGRWQSGLTPCEGDRFCWTCTEAYLDARTNPVRIGADGKPAGRGLDYVTPMSGSRFSEGDRQAVRNLRRQRPQGKR